MLPSAPGTFRLLSTTPRVRVLHVSWLAFFISFLVWFNQAPLMAAIRDSLQLSKEQVATLLIVNVALTIPARVLVGMFVDKFGPRHVYTALLLAGGGLCISFALVSDFTALAILRLLLGCVGAGFVIGIRLIAEWFPARESGYAQGIYAGLGNFGSAAGAVTLPTLAVVFGGAEGWRWAIAITGIISIAYAGVFYWLVTDTPPGSTYFKPKKTGAMEVTSRGDFLFYVLMQAPLVLALGALVWKLGPVGLHMLSPAMTWSLSLALAALYVVQIGDSWRVNRGLFAAKTPVPVLHRYRFCQVAALDIAYMITFGSELAVISILPLLFKDMFGLSLAMAGFVGASFGMTTFFARPAGGWLSDRFGRRRILLICLTGTAAGYGAMSLIGTATGLMFAVGVTFLCSLFVNAGNGAVYAMLPMIKRRLTGQIAGMVGAFGNVGGVVFLVVYSLVDIKTFFLIAAASAVLGWVIAAFWIDEPRGQIAEEMPDGSIALIDVT